MVESRHAGPQALRRRTDTGMSLTEILVVVIVLGILAGVAFLAVGRIRDQSTDTTCDAQRVTIERAVSVWRESGRGEVTYRGLVEAGILESGTTGFVVMPDGTVLPLPGGRCDTAAGRSEAAAGAGDGAAGGTGSDRSPPAAGAGSNDTVAADAQAGAAASAREGVGGQVVRPEPSPVGESPVVLGKGPVDLPTDIPPAVPVPFAGGELEFVLTWTGNADVDLWVRDPLGEMVGWAAPRAGGGVLDVDVIPPDPEAMGPHVERIVWRAGDAKIGTYVAWTRFESGGWGPQDGVSYTLTVRTGDTILQTVRAPVQPGGSQGTPMAVRLAE